MDQRSNKAINLVSDIAARYHISSIEPLLASCRAAVAQDEISIAVIGRFKAGKSSFLNHFLKRDLAPVGVIPVTAIVTEISYGAREKASAHFLDGRVEEIDVEAIRQFVAESENPENAKGVARLIVELPTLERLKGLRFVDTPGLESALAHNTEASLKWLPNVGLALVAVSTDHPLSQQDVALLKNLYQYTPKVSVLLTKTDLLDEAERAEVLTFMREQLTRNFEFAPEVLPYSVRPGYEQFRAYAEERLISGTLAEFQAQRERILERKLETLLGECRDYLRLALSSAEMIESERGRLKEQVIGEKEALDEVKSELRLVIRHAAGGTRARIAARLKTHQAEITTRLLSELKAEFPKWTKSLNYALESFEAWLHRALAEEMIAASNKERAQFVAPLTKINRQVFRTLQNFRDRLSERTMQAYGVPLRTTEAEIEIAEPRSPDIRVGKVFDRNWEMLSPVTPRWLVKSLVARHFAGTVPYMVEKNLSRLASQWETSINAAMKEIGSVAERRLDELIETVERLVTGSRNDAPQIRADIERINSVLNEITEEASLSTAGTYDQRSREHQATRRE